MNFNYPATLATTSAFFISMSKSEQSRDKSARHNLASGCARNTSERIGDSNEDHNCAKFEQYPLCSENGRFYDTVVVTRLL